MEWLRQQPDTSTEPEIGDTSALNLFETLNVKHIEVQRPERFMLTTFAMSQQSDSIGIASALAKPSLSVMYHGTDKPPLILSRDDLFTATVVITISAEEYLAATFKESIHLRNLATNTSRVVFKFMERDDWRLCVINERTVACVAEQPGVDGYSKIYTLNTGSEKFNLSSTLRVKAGRGITDICFVKTADGTSCLILCKPLPGLIESVEMVGRKVRWQLGMQQMGTSFNPWSICTDGIIIFVADAGSIKLHLLSVNDGSVVTSINLYRFGIYLPTCVRLQGELLYVGHKEQKERYCITKFAKPRAVSGIDM